MKDSEILNAISNNILGLQSYNQEYCMDGVTLNYLINPNSPQTGYNPSLESPGNINEIGFFAPRIMIRESKKSMMGMGSVTLGNVTDQPYAFKDPNIIQNLLNFFGYTPEQEYQLRSQGQSPVQELLCSLATPRPGGAPSPLEYIIISNHQGVIENKHYINNTKPTKISHPKDAEIKQKQFLEISSNIKSNSASDIEKVSEIKGKFIKSALWWSSVSDL